MKKGLVLLGLGGCFLLIGLVVGLIHHELFWQSMIVLGSFLCICLGMFYRARPKAWPIVLMIAAMVAGVGVCWALYKHHLFAEMILASMGFLSILAGLLQFEKRIPRSPKTIKNLLQYYLLHW